MFSSAIICYLRQGLTAEGDLFELIKQEVQRDAGARKRSLSGARQVLFI